MNSWDDQGFRDAIKATGRKNIILTGLWTEVCVTWPCIEMLGEGYNVYVVEDCCGATSQAAHDAALSRMVQAGAVRLTAVRMAETIFFNGKITTLGAPSEMQAIAVANGGEELSDYTRWLGMTHPGQGSELLKVNGAGENLVWSAADFENFLQPRPELVPTMEAELETV